MPQEKRSDAEDKTEDANRITYVSARVALVKKLAKILGELRQVKKGGFNSFHKYKYVGEGDVLEMVRQKLADAEIFIFSSQEECDKKEVRRIKDNHEKVAVSTLLKVKYTFTDGNAEISVYAYGESEDTDDKGVYKAATGAMKYFMMKNFLMTSGDDPETGSADASGSRVPQGGARRQAPAPAPGGKAAPPAVKRYTIEAKLFGIYENDDPNLAAAGSRGLDIGDGRFIETNDAALVEKAKGFVNHHKAVMFEVEDVPGFDYPQLRGAALKE